jgi:hypothetical protein
LNSHHLVAFLTLIGSYIALHYYSAAWLARSFALSAGMKRNLLIALLLLALFGPLTMLLRHPYIGPALAPIYLAGYTWMGIILLAGVIFLFSDLLGLGLQRLLSQADMRFFRFGTVVFAGGMILLSLYNGLKTPGFRELKLSVPGLPAAMEGLKIIQLSDLHIDTAYKLEQYSEIVNGVNTRAPDLVLVTGDLPDPGLPSDGRLAELTRRLKPRLGVFGVFGNHEYYYGYERSLALYKECGINLLRNESSDAAGFRIIGLNDIMTENMTEKEVAAILNKHRSPGFSILMTHQPVMLDLMAENGNFIGFSGHTHRGQLFPFHILTRMGYKYFYESYHIRDSFFYITSGAGTWGLPMRLFAPTEIPVVTLTGK